MFKEQPRCVITIRTVFSTLMPPCVGVTNVDLDITALSDIPVIPDLEDAPDEDFTAQVAMAPKYVMHHPVNLDKLF